MDINRYRVEGREIIFWEFRLMNFCTDSLPKAVHSFLRQKLMDSEGGRFQSWIGYGLLLQGCHSVMGPKILLQILKSGSVQFCWHINLWGREPLPLSIWVLKMDKLWFTKQRDRKIIPEIGKTHFKGTETLKSILSWNLFVGERNEYFKILKQHNRTYLTGIVECHGLCALYSSNVNIW